MAKLIAYRVFPISLPTHVQPDGTPTAEPNLPAFLALPVAVESSHLASPPQEAFPAPTAPAGLPPVHPPYVPPPGPPTPQANWSPAAPAAAAPPHYPAPQAPPAPLPYMPPQVPPASPPGPWSNTPASPGNGGRRPRARKNEVSIRTNRGSRQVYFTHYRTETLGLGQCRWATLYPQQDGGYSIFLSIAQQNSASVELRAPTDTDGGRATRFRVPKSALSTLADGGYEFCVERLADGVMVTLYPHRRTSA